jgi:hypothetical protein
MSSKNLWGDITSGEPVRTPTTILKEQATALTEMTKGTLVGKVALGGDPGSGFEIALYVITPAINNYRFDVLYVMHGIELYPAYVMPAWDRFLKKERVQCQDENELADALGRILSSEKVTRSIKSLISQSKAMK